MWSPPPRPRWVERLNAYGAAVGDARALVSLDADELLGTARESTGLDDFGGDGWRKHYDVLLRALEAESRLHLAGRLLVRSEALRSLHNRLRLTELWRRDPGILQEPVHPPVFILGTPRSGTSILHELLALDPRHRTPGTWEVLHPVEALEGEALRSVADAEVQFWHDLQPEYETMHHNAGELPTECIFITMNEFLSDQWGGCHVVPSYDAHLYAADQTPAYEFHRRVLKTLQRRSRAERWVLKAPSHLGQLRTLFGVYPDARIVHIHRDPLKTLPSTISLTGTLKWMRCEVVDMSRAPVELPQGFAHSLRDAIAARSRGELPDGRFADLRYHELMAHPVAAIGDVYARFGWDYPAELQGAIDDYLARKAQGKHGAHRYTPEELGLDREAERERFRFYRDRFGIPDET